MESQAMSDALDEGYLPISAGRNPDEAAASFLPSNGRRISPTGASAPEKFAVRGALRVQNWYDVAAIF
jgi:hypothetical protein